VDILIADDEPFMQRSLSFVLRKEGFEVEVASNGEEAIQKAKKFRPTIIFLDVMMPKMNGFFPQYPLMNCNSLRSCHRVTL